MEHSPETMRHCVVAYLEDIRVRRSVMADLEWRIDSLRERLEGLGMTQGEHVAGGMAEDMADKLARIHELEAKWATAAAESAEAIAVAASMCPASEPERYCLWLHYVERMTWSEVARKLGYSVQHVRGYLAAIGYVELYTMMPEEYRRYTIPNAAPE